ncbi:MAG: 50S ribosomal protein L22 [Chloroflexi bacterium]|nr:50S ribosomal protein L22 [Chloroflexota bacterium]
MQVKASAKNIGYSYQKVKLIADTVRGKKVDDALALLKFLPSPSARAVAKVVKSAASNAENNYQLVPANLKVVSIYADKGRTLRRFRPRARGRANEVLRRSSHITVVVEEKEA